LKKIVLTGGPGGGKSTAAELFRREVGESIVVVPEAATMLYKGGLPRTDDIEASRAIQKAIFHTQVSLEDVYEKLYPNRVLLCDRGTIDGSAYWPMDRNSFYEYFETNKKEQFNRYDTVLFFETAAVGKLEIEGGNPVRVESIDEAIALDKKLKYEWKEHTDFIFIPHQQSFLAKINLGLCVLQKVLRNTNELLK